MEMGLVPGTEITFLKTSPLEIHWSEIGGRNLALRRSEAATVWVRRKRRMKAMMPLSFVREGAVVRLKISREECRFAKGWQN